MLSSECRSCRRSSGTITSCCNRKILNCTQAGTLGTKYSYRMYIADSDAAMTKNSSRFSSDAS